jgi:two-component system sensor histidine kinase SenX3
VRTLSDILVHDCDLIVRRWSESLRRSAHPRRELSEAQLKHKIGLQLRTIGAWLDDVCPAGAQKSSTIWGLPESLDPEARVQQDIPIEEVVLHYGLLAETVLGLLEGRMHEVSPNEIALFFQALIALIAETARRYAASKEAQQTQERAAYLARLAHQMRTPLTVLKLHAGALSRSDPLTNGHLVGSIERNVKRLTRLVDGVMRLERFRPEEIPVRPIELSPAKLIDQVVDDNTYEAERKALRVEVLVNRVLRMQVDPTLFVDALGNLLHNAIKYTEAGHVRIEVEERATEVVFKVRDTGPGIPRERQLSMFETVEPDQAGGAGLGLTIVHRATVAQGGTVGVESEPGQGSLFWFTLPRTVTPRNVLPDP